jgi:hypothetical protein
MAPATAAVIPDQEGTFSMGSCHTLDQLDSCFDDTQAVANAGLLLAATLAERLGIEQAADALIDLGEQAGAAHPGRKLYGQRGVRTQNSLPSGSVRTIQRTSPWPMSIGSAPTARRRATSALWSPSEKGATSRCTRSLAVLVR